MTLITTSLSSGTFSTRQAHLGMSEEGAIPLGELPEVAESILQPLESVATGWLPGCLIVFAISVVISIGKRANRQPSE